MKIRGFHLLSAVVALICVLSAGVLSGCSSNEDPTIFDTVPVLEDTRDTAEKMNTFVTLNGDSVTYNLSLIHI